MRNRFKSRAITLLSLTITLLSLLFAVTVWAATSGSTDSPAGPTDSSAQMYTLEQIYARLDAGTTESKMTTFAEPSSGPTAGTMNTLDQIMGVAPAVDETNGAVAADVVSGKTFWGLTSGAWGLQTGTGYAAAVPKTGDAYNDPCCTGEDGTLQKGITWPSPRFTDNTNGTVTDNLTGLMWMKDADAGNDCAGLDTGKKSWADALASAAACNTAAYAGYTDWRLPNLRELQSLIDYGQSFPALPSGHPFTNVRAALYWSSTSWAYTTSYAWEVSLSLGGTDVHVKSVINYVWPVRGGQ